MTTSSFFGLHDISICICTAKLVYRIWVVSTAETQEKLIGSAVSGLEAAVLSANVYA